MSNPTTPSTRTSTSEDVNEYAIKIVSFLESKSKEVPDTPEVTFLDSTQGQNTAPVTQPATTSLGLTEQHTGKLPMTGIQTEAEESDENISEVSDFPHLDSVIHNSISNTEASVVEGGASVSLFMVSAEVPVVPSLAHPNVLPYVQVYMLRRGIVRTRLGIPEYSIDTQ